MTEISINGFRDDLINYRFICLISMLKFVNFHGFNWVYNWFTNSFRKLFVVQAATISNKTFRCVIYIFVIVNSQEFQCTTSFIFLNKSSFCFTRYGNWHQLEFYWKFWHKCTNKCSNISKYMFETSKVVWHEEKKNYCWQIEILNKFCVKIDWLQAHTHTRKSQRQHFYFYTLNRFHSISFEVFKRTSKFEYMTVCVKKK